MILLIDTNVLLDALQDREPFAAAAEGIWKLVEEEALIGYVSAISFNNIYYIARKQAGAEKALEAIRLVRGVFRIFALDELIIDRALAAPGRDFEDAIQAATATRVGADYLVTRNARDFESTGAKAITASDLLSSLQAQNSLEFCMVELLTAEAYEQTKEKLRDLQSRLAGIKKRTDLTPAHLASVQRSYNSMIREYLQDIRLYEISDGKSNSATPRLTR